MWDGCAWERRRLFGSTLTPSHGRLLLFQMKNLADGVRLNLEGLGCLAPWFI